MKNQQEEEQLTAEQLAERKEEMKAYFEEALPYLEAQHKYEKLLADISEAKFKRFQWDTQLSMAMYQMQHPEEIETEEKKEEAPKEKKLKKG
jgi:energy-coupling factor transporter ATP-binding protein EcfA2